MLLHRNVIALSVQYAISIYLSLVILAPPKCSYQPSTGQDTLAVLRLPELVQFTWCAQFQLCNLGLLLSEGWPRFLAYKLNYNVFSWNFSFSLSQGNLPTLTPFSMSLISHLTFLPHFLISSEMSNPKQNEPARFLHMPFLSLKYLDPCFC